MSTQIGGYAGKVLKINLTTKEVSEYPWSDQDRMLYLGGKVMASKILYDNITEKMDAFAPENMIVITTGPLSGTNAPCSSRFNISSISPLTGISSSSNCGGNFGLHLKKAGYDGLILVGKADEKTWIEITDEDIQFHNADHLWGQKTNETQESIGGRAGKIVIGPAGENLVKYAGIFSQERTAGRAGIGAVMGSKNLKAVTATGKQKVTIAQPEKTKKLIQKWIKMLQKHPLTGEELPQLGSANLLRKMQKRGVLATHNFKYGKFDDYDMISGETMAEKYLIKNVGCVTCPIRCGRQVEVNGKKVKGPELETLGLLGANLDNNDLKKIIDWNYQLDELGMDTISVGGTIGFAMELNENGLWDSGLEFGKIDNFEQIFEDIAYRRGIGDELAEGSRFLSEKYGGEDYCNHAKGLEIAAYEPRGAVGHGLGIATANRGGCHLNAGYMVLMEALGMHWNPRSTWAKTANAILNQNLFESVSSSGNCLFPLFTFVLPFFARHPEHPITKMVNTFMLTTGFSVNMINRFPGLAQMHLPMLPHTKTLTAITGKKFNLATFLKIGERGYNLERLVNLRFGISSKDDTLPKRMTTIPQDPKDPKTIVPLEKMKKQYYRVRGWTPEGVPTEHKKRQLQIS